jgi:hypothetical protein
LYSIWSLAEGLTQRGGSPARRCTIYLLLDAAKFSRRAFDRRPLLVHRETWNERLRERRTTRELILDKESLVSEIRGSQEGSA